MLSLPSFLWESSAIRNFCLNPCLFTDFCFILEKWQMRRGRNYFFACHGRQVEDGSAMDQANSRKTGTGILSGWEKKHLSMMEDVSKGFARVKPFYPESFEKRLDESVPGVMYRWAGIWVRWEKGTWSRQTWVLWLEVCVCADFKSSLSCVQVGRRDWGKAR